MRLFQNLAKDQDHPSEPGDMLSKATKEAPAGSSPPPGQDKDVETQLYDAMDRAALIMIKVLEDESTDLKIRLNVFEKADQWLTKRQKLKPKADDAAGVGLLRDMMKSPAETAEELEENVEFRAQLMKMGWLPPPPKKNGRPNAQEQAYRTAYDERKVVLQGTAAKGDDSQLAKMLARAGGEEE